MRIRVEDGENLRLDQYLSEYFEGISRSKLAKLIKSGDVLVNEKSEKASYQVNDDDIIEIDLTALDIKPLEKEDLNVQIIYQDKDIAVVNKAAGIVSHPTNTIRSNTLVNFLISKFDNLPTIYGEDRAGIVHRLDKDTSGLMIVALNDESMLALKEAFKNRDIIKRYRAIVVGKMENKTEKIESFIGRSQANRKLMTVTDEGKYALTEYKVLQESQGYSYLDLILHTGRTHQIRVHTAYLRHPILGDPDYNKTKSAFNISGQLLQAYYLEFNHPISGQKMTFEIPMYPEFEKYYKIIFEDNNDTNNTNI